MGPEPVPTVENDDVTAIGSNEASAKSNPDSHDEFCCFVGPCGTCEAKAESNSACALSKSKCESCTGHATWCPRESLAFVMKEGRFDPHMESRINQPIHDSLVGKVALSAVSFITITMTVAAVMFGIRRWQHTRFYGHIPLPEDANVVAALAPSRGELA